MAEPGWIEACLAEQVDAIADYVGERDESAVDAARYLACRLRALGRDAR